MAILTGDSGPNTLLGTNANDTITGGGGNDRLEGRGGNDTLNGGTGIDRLIGGAGNDLYIIDNITEIAKATEDAGVDTVQSSVTYTLGEHQEHLTLAGTAALNGTGNVGANTIVGNSGLNFLFGLGGNDTLTGNGGDDTLRGGAGNDSVNGGAGIDVLWGDAGNDVLVGSTGDDNLLAGAGNDSLNGGIGNDGLTGGDGTDSVRGGIGDDTYYVGDANDTVLENPEEGNDTVTLMFEGESIESYTMPANIEVVYLSTGSLLVIGNLLDNEMYSNSDTATLNGAGGNDTLEGTTGIDTLIGGGGNDQLTSHSASDVLNGGSGDDTLNGGTENDTLTGGTGNDNFLFDSDIFTTDGEGQVLNVDVITDFSGAGVEGGDVIQLDSSLFFGLTTSNGVLTDMEFERGSGFATEETTRIVYDIETGALYYDHDGTSTTGLGAEYQIATITGSPDGLTFTDFMVVGVPG